MKRMLFNATHAEELRVAIVDGQKLIDLDLESALRTEKKGNIYKGKVTAVAPSLEACFVDYGAERQGFLPFKEIYREYFQDYNQSKSIADTKIESVIKEGQEMVVQVDKDERATKGAALTTFISLAGRFLVLMSNNPKGGGISRRVSGDERTELRQILSNLEVNSKHSLIARTEGIGRNQEELQWDLDFLVKVWDTIEEASSNAKAPFLIYRESNLIVRSIRDHLTEDITEIVVDDEEVFDRAQRFISQVMPQKLNKLKMYSDSVPLFSRYQIETQIDSAFNREVNLPSGGSLAIDHTEALISVDVNSARATKGGDIEETALQTNLEAVEELARQLRIRDLGGLVVIDLIDMGVNKHQRAVENKLKEVLQADRARVQVGHISRFGLLEMSRQRLRSSISEMNYRMCPRCEGMGNIRNVVSSSLNLLRIIEDEALKENTEALQVSLPLDMATYLFNEKRHELLMLESRLSSRIIIIPSDELSSPHFHLKRLRSDELDEIADTASFMQKMKIDSREPDVTDSLKVEKPERPHVQLDQIGHSAPPPEVARLNGASEADKNGKSGLISRIFKSVFTGDEEMEKPANDPKPAKKPAPRNRGGAKRQGQNSSGAAKPAANRNNNNRRGGGARRLGQSSRSQKPAQDDRQGEKSNTQDRPSGNSRTAAEKPRRQSPRNNERSAPRGNRPPARKPRSNNRTGSNRPNPNKQNQQHPGPIVSVENIPADLPDDIGNRKE